MPTNSNYQETNEGWERKSDAPNAQHESRINWGRVDSVNNARQGVSDLREKQNQRNEEHRKSHTK